MNYLVIHSGVSTNTQIINQSPRAQANQHRLLLRSYSVTSTRVLLKANMKLAWKSGELPKKLMCQSRILLQENYGLLVSDDVCFVVSFICSYLEIVTIVNNNNIVVTENS